MRASKWRGLSGALWAWFAATCVASAVGGEPEPANLAPKAKVSASSEYSPAYAARFAVDGRIPPPKSGEEGGSPYTSWIWTINGTERNILEIRPKRWGSPASKLADLILAGHPGASGKAQAALSDAERRRVFLWIDLNVPYYGTSASNHRDRAGCRHMLPPELKPVLDDVAARRCVGCHPSGVPRTFYTRMIEPERNNFLLAPLAKAAGGTEACGRPVFASRDDPDYRKILDTFRPIQALLKAKPRADMDGLVEPPCVVPQAPRERVTQSGR